MCRLRAGDRVQLIPPALSTKVGRLGTIKSGPSRRWRGYYWIVWDGTVAPQEWHETVLMLEDRPRRGAE